MMVWRLGKEVAESTDLSKLLFYKDNKMQEDVVIDVSRSKLVDFVKENPFATDNQIEQEATRLGGDRWQSSPGSGIQYRDKGGTFPREHYIKIIRLDAKNTSEPFAY